MSDRAPTVMALTFARQGEEAAISKALNWLRREFPEARVVAVGTEVSGPKLRDLGVDEVVEFGGERGAKETAAEAKARNPMAAAIIYGGPGYHAHLKLELLALAVGAGKTYRLVPGRPPRAMGRAVLLASVVGKSVRAAGYLLTAALICGTALCWLLLAQTLGGGGHARRS